MSNCTHPLQLLAIVNRTREGRYLIYPSSKSIDKTTIRTYKYSVSPAQVGSVGVKLITVLPHSLSIEERFLHSGTYSLLLRSVVMKTDGRNKRSNCFNYCVAFGFGFHPAQEHAIIKGNSA